MKNQQVSNSQSFVPNSRTAKKAGKLSAEAALKNAKSLNRPVIFLSRGQSSDFKKPDKNEVPDSEKRYTSSEAAGLIGIKLNNLLQHVKNKNIRGIKKKSKWMFSGEEIERFKASRNQNS